jgi:uncharacterized Zn finger protein/superfamily II DNA or RNA helicase
MVRWGFGKTWWGKMWIEALESIDYSNRLPRGRSYANAGAVTEIEVRDGSVYARVQGTRTRPYKIVIKLEPFYGEQQEILFQVIREHPLLAAELSLGKLPEELYELLKSEGVKVFPGSWSAIGANCSCPDHANPCKHLAAVYYLLANEIDKDPFILFELRGIVRVALAGIRERVTDDTGFVPVDELSARPQEPVEFTLAGLAGRQNEARTLFGLLAESPLFYPGFKKVLMGAYRTLAQFAEDIEPEERNFSRQVSLCLFLERKFGHPAESTTVFVYEQSELPERPVGKSVPVVEGENVKLGRKRGEVVPLSSVLEQFLYLPLILDGSLDVNFMSAAASTALTLMKTSLFFPEVVRNTSGEFYIYYRARMEDQDVQVAVEQLEKLLPPGLLYCAKEKSVLSGQQAVEFVLSLYLAYFMKNFVNMPLATKLFYAFFGTAVYIPEKFEERQTGKAVADWLTPLAVGTARFMPLVRVELPVGKQKKFRVYLDVEDREATLDAPLPLGDVTATSFGLPVDEVLVQLARVVAVAGEYCQELKSLLDQQGKPLAMSGLELSEFLSEGKNILKLLGIVILLPKELQSVVSSRLVLSGKSRNSQISYLTLSEVVDFSWEVAVDDLQLSQEEFIRLAESAEGVVRYRDRYLLLEPAQIHRMLAQLKKPVPRVSGAQILSAGLTGEAGGALFQLDKPLQQLITELQTVRDVSLPAGLDAVLRPYQERGFCWLYGNWEMGLGSCLADDMGLGKTLQVIALILKLKEEDKLKEPVLVVCPTTLLGNWEKECARFAPSLRVAICHGPDREIATDGVDVLLTTYGVIRNDKDLFARVHWSVLVIDEAQNIKNNDSAQSQALKKLKAGGYVAMSGTPVENRLDELWSIFDFMLPGYLGSRKGFARRFAVPIEKYRDRERVRVLRQATAPFVLRRMKTDKTVIADLPDKVVKNQYCRLTAEQAVLYRKVVEREMSYITNSDGMARRGLIFRLMTALKQVCNHPVHYSRLGVPQVDHSGKAQMTLSLLEQIINDGEKALIFTQYKEMGELLVTMLKAELGLDVPFFHGSLQRKKRELLVEDFQHKEGSPLLLVSLKAGGTGLNLTEACHVFHYDLWWNPAVEDQATDRAYRIGQTKNVSVHRFITLGTLEEKIDAMLSVKKELAEMTVSAGETWLTEMSDKELRDIFTLVVG